MRAPENYFVPCGLLGLVVSLLIYQIIRRWSGSFSFAGGRPAQFHHASASSGAIPRLGGIGMVGGLAAVCLLAALIHDFAPLATKKFWVLAGSSLAMFAAGITDDLRPLGAKRKFILQILISLGAYYLGVQIDHLRDPISGAVVQLGGWGVVVTVFWLVAMTNLINLIDGIDGLAGGIGIMLMGLLAWSCFPIENGFYSLLCVGVVGALLGFLRFNFPPAKIYMGDGGAYFLGFLIGLISIETSNKGRILAALTAPALALALPILDMLLTLVRRGVKGLPLFRPDFDHIHHRLVRQGLTRKRAVLVLYAFSVVSLGLAVGVFTLAGEYVPLFIGTATLALIIVLRMLRVIPAFWQIGSTVQSHWRLRWLSRYTLTLSTWLQLEAEKSRSVEDLWVDYAFFVKKIGVSRVKLRLGGVEKHWEGKMGDGAIRHRRHAFPIQGEMVIEFTCPEGHFTLPEFEHVTELAAEAWLKALTRWEIVTRKKAAFASTETAPVPVLVDGHAHAHASADSYDSRFDSVTPIVPQRDTIGAS